MAQPSKPIINILCGKLPPRPPHRRVEQEKGRYERTQMRRYVVKRVKFISNILVALAWGNNRVGGIRVESEVNLNVRGIKARRENLL